jgi:hypothetical protein
MLMCYMWLSRRGAIVCHFKYEFVQKRRSAQKCVLFFIYLMNKGVLM